MTHCDISFYLPTSFLALPRIVPFGRPLAPNILACSVLTMSIRLLLNAVRSACVQTFRLPFSPFRPFFPFPRLNLPVTWSRWHRGFALRTEDPGTGFPVSVTHQQYPVPGKNHLLYQLFLPKMCKTYPCGTVLVYNFHLHCRLERK